MVAAKQKQDSRPEDIKVNQVVEMTDLLKKSKTAAEDKQ